MKRLFTILFPVMIFMYKSSPAQWLHAKDTFMVDEQQRPVLLRGIGLGGWMLQEGYMFHLSKIGQQYRIRQKIEETVGKEKANEFYERWLLLHTTKEDIAFLAAHGFNSIRLPMHFNLFTLPVDEEAHPGIDTWISKGFQITDSLLRWCTEYKLYLVLDLHAAPGGQGNDLPISDRDPAKPSLWESEANRNKTIALWKEIAKRYANEPWIGGYDLLNEPNWGFEDPLKDKRGTAERKNIPLRNLLVDITTAIRSVDKRHMIIIEGNGFGNNYNGIIPDWDNNIALSFHKYGNYNTTASIQYFLDLRSTHRKPIWLGESGENSNTWFTEAISLMERNNIGWNWWQLKKMGISNPLEIVAPKDFQVLIDYWTGGKQTLSPSIAWSILDEWLTNLSIHRNIIHADVTDAMLRQVRSNSTLPFAEHTINDSFFLPAVHYDLGKQGIAYYDSDSVRYQYTPGVNTEGNRGYSFRNDGVDIRCEGKSDCYVFHTAAGEWLQYTIRIEKTADYIISLHINNSSDSVISTRVSFNKRNVATVGKDKVFEEEVKVHPSTVKKNVETISSRRIEKGVYTIRVLFGSIGANFYGINFKQTKSTR